jgi:hypothetical protein
VSQEPEGQVVAMGGGGFSVEPDNPLLDDFICPTWGLQQTRLSRDARRQPVRRQDLNCLGVLDRLAS